MVWYSPLFQNFPQFIVIHTVKGFGIVNKAEIYVFLEISYFFDNTSDVGNLISGSSAFPKTSLNIWKFTVHILLNPGLDNFEHYFTSMWDEGNYAVVWAFFEEAEVERFCEDLQELLELTCKKDVLFITGDWIAKVGSQETPGVSGRFGLGVWNDTDQRLKSFAKRTHRL